MARRTACVVVGMAGLLPACTDAATRPAGGEAVAASGPSQPEDTTEASLAEFLRGDDRFDVLTALFESRDVPGHERSFLHVLDHESTPGTLFAPTDAAFERLPEDALTVLRDAPWLTSLLEKHVAHGTHRSTGLETDRLQTWGVGSVVPVERDGDLIRYGGAPVIEVDLEVGDWLVHVLDGVVLPAAAEAALEDA